MPGESYRRLFSDQPLPPPAGSSEEFRSADVERTRSDDYDGCLSYMDACARELLESLRQRGLAENLILVVAADHGDLLGEHGLLGHRNALYWDLIRVPLIFWRASGLPRGLRIERPVSLVSLPATLLELAGQSDPGGFPAPSLAQLWRAGGDAGNWLFPEASLAQIPYSGLEQNLNYSGALSAIVTPRWLLIHHSAHGPALYDWTRDPENLHNLARGYGVDGVSAALVNCLQGQGSTAGGAICQADLAGKLESPSAAGDPAVIGQQ